jgi:arylsulfatase A-like enzyme/Flp pilus assembly protein TadD
MVLPMHLPMLLLLAIACTPDPALPSTAPVDTRPDVLLVTIDTLRADRVGAYGDSLAQTPMMDGLAAQSALFRSAHSVTPLTLPSHASMLTGRYPVNHGLRDNGGFRLDDHVPTLASALAEAGYTTGAFVSAFVLDGAWGLERGFSTYRDPFHPQKVAQVGAFGEVELPSAEVVNAAAAWWKQAEGPRFAWVHLYDPHTPWRDHPGWEGDPYRGEVAYADSQLRRLLALTDKDDLVIVTSDHGEGLWDHGEREHGLLLGPTITRVPLIVRPPGDLAAGPAVVARPTPEAVSKRPAGVDATLNLEPVPNAPQARRVVDATVSGVDIAPTIAEYAGVPFPGADGQSLREHMEGGPAAARVVYAETFFPLFHYGWSALLMATNGEVRVEEGATAQRIDVATDPAGAHATAAGRDHEFRAVIDGWRGTETPRPGPIPGDAAAALEALGYVTQAADTTGDLPDPRDQIGVLAELHEAEGAADPAEAVRRLRRVVGRYPDMVDGHIALSLALADTGDLKAALAETQVVLERWPDHPTALSNGGFLARTLGDQPLALDLARRMRALNPQDPRGYRLEAAVLVDQDDAIALLEVTRAGVQVAPDDPNLHYLLALGEIEAGDPMAGVPHLLAAREHGTEARDIDLWLGVAHQRAGRIPEATQHYEAATRSMAGDPRPWAMAGVMLWKAGLCKEARPFLINVARRGGGNDPQIRQALGECEASIAAEKQKGR